MNHCLDGVIVGEIELDFTLKNVNSDQHCEYYIEREMYCVDLGFFTGPCNCRLNEQVRAYHCRINYGYLR